MGEESPQYTLRCQLFGHEEDVSLLFFSFYFVHRSVAPGSCRLTTVCFDAEEIVFSMSVGVVPSF